jgi:hypothetical protein
MQARPAGHNMTEQRWGASLAYNPSFAYSIWLLSYSQSQQKYTISHKKMRVVSAKFLSSDPEIISYV